jgi:hypothetical protein
MKRYAKVATSCSPDDHVGLTLGVSIVPWQTALMPIRSLLQLCLRWLVLSVCVNVHNRLATGGGRQ